MKESIIKIPDTHQLVKVGENEYEIVPKPTILPKTWKEFCEHYPVRKIERYITSDSELDEVGRMGNHRSEERDKNVLPNPELAEAILALCQLIQLRDCYRQGWVPNFNAENNQKKWKITFDRGFILCSGGYCADDQDIFVFQSQEIQLEFKNNFKDLLEKVKPLFS